MPELPEVEIARRNLSRWLRGHRILEVTAPKTRVLRPLSPTKLVKALHGREVERVVRKGKWLRIELDHQVALYAHLGMSGRWVKRERDAAPEKHERLRLDLARASICYVDPRLFGRLVLREDGEALAAWDELGPDPLTDGLDPRALVTSLGKVRRSIKETLLDQTRFAGVGNIQATEALWRARISPVKPARELSSKEIGALVRGIHASIEETLAREKGPEITYVEDAGAPNPFDVYGKAKSPCPRCRTLLSRIVQGGRATVFCPRCQRR